MPDLDSMSQDMLRFLERTRPHSSSSALAELRMAFPEAKLCDRVRACRNWHDEATPVTEIATDTLPSS